MCSALDALVRTLDGLRIPCAIVGAMALNEFGYQRMTSDVNVLLTADGLAAFKAARLGRGYVEKFPGSRGLRDTEHGVDIDVVLAGDYPGDGKPRPVRFPDPAAAAERGARVALLPLAGLVELKPASGLTAPHRLRDLADVQELIRVRQLPRDLADALDGFVRDSTSSCGTRSRPDRAATADTPRASRAPAPPPRSGAGRPPAECAQQDSGTRRRSRTVTQAAGPGSAMRRVGVTHRSP